MTELHTLLFFSGPHSSVVQAKRGPPHDAHPIRPRQPNVMKGVLGKLWMIQEGQASTFNNQLKYVQNYFVVS